MDNTKLLRGRSRPLFPRNEVGHFSYSSSPHFCSVNECASRLHVTSLCVCNPSWEGGRLSQPGGYGVTGGRGREGKGGGGRGGEGGGGGGGGWRKGRRGGEGVREGGGAKGEMGGRETEGRQGSFPYLAVVAGGRGEWVRMWGRGGGGKREGRHFNYLVFAWRGVRLGTWRTSVRTGCAWDQWSCNNERRATYYTLRKTILDAQQTPTIRWPRGGWVTQLAFAQ